MSELKSRTRRKDLSYALAAMDGGYRAVAVRPVGEARWRVEHWERGASAPLPAGWVRELNASDGRVAWLLAEDDVTCAMTPLPRLNRRELNRAVAGWVARKEGGQPADWSLSWRQLGAAREGDGRQNFYLAYAAKSVTDRESAAAAKLAVRPGLMLPPSLLLDQLFRRAGRDLDALKVWNLVFIGEHASILCVANRECLLLSRTLPRDVAAAVSDAEYLERLVVEVDRSGFFARQAEGVANVDRIVVCGEAGLAADLVAKLGADSATPVEHWPLTEIIDPRQHRPTATEQLLLAAAALAGETVDYNLAPARERRWLDAQSRRRVMLAVGTAAAALVPILSAGALVTSRVQQHYLEEARTRLAVASEHAESAAAIYERQRVLRAREEHLERFGAERPDLAAVLLHLAAVTPPQVRYRDLQIIAGQDRIRLHLTAESTAATVTEAQQAFLKFHGALGASAILRSLGEPRQLQITEQDQAGQVHKAVLFSLDFELARAATTGVRS